MEERKGVVTFKGKPVTLLGPELQVGRRAPDFKLIDSNMKEVELSQSKGKVRLLSVVYSLETPVCDLQTQTFEKAAGTFPKVVVTLLAWICLSLRLDTARNIKCQSENPLRPPGCFVRYGLRPVD